MLWALMNWRKILAIGIGSAIIILVAYLYIYGNMEHASRLTAEASLVESEQKLAIVQKSLADMIATREAMDLALSQRDTERQETQERLRSASTELSQLRRQNAELRDYLDRPIPADVVRVLHDATRSAGGKAVPAKDASR